MTSFGESKHRPCKILVISPAPSHPQNSGNRVRIYHLLRNLKELGHEVHLFLLDKEYRSNHVAESADIDSMADAWDGFYYLQDHPRLAFGSLFDRLGLRWLRRALLPHNASRKKGLFWKLRNRLGSNSWRVLQFKYAVICNVTQLIDRILRIPRRIRRSIGRVLKRILPSVYGQLKPHFPDKKGFSLTANDSATNVTGSNGGSADVSQIDSWYNFNINESLQALHLKERFDAVIVEYVYLSYALTNFGSDVRKIIDTHDVFTDRAQQYEDMGLVETFFSTTREEEAKGLGRADAIIAIQDEEREVLQALTPKPVITVGHTVHLTKPCPITEVRKAVLFIGTANAANIHSVEWFLQEVMPLILEDAPTFNFYVAGQVCAFIEDHKNVIKLGEVEDLRAIYDCADVVINPAAVGSGLKIKCIEALGRGKVLVSSPHASSGLGEGHRKAYIEADGAREFASGIINLFSNVDVYNEFSLRAYRFARKYNQTTLSSLQHLIGDNVSRWQPTNTQARSTLRNPLAKQPDRAPSFMIIAAARTGSTTLADLLNVHPAVSCLLEPFNPEHGVLWGKKRYLEQMENGSLLIDAVRNIFAEYQGFKHLTEQLTPAQNELLIRFPEARCIFLWRRNHLQRMLSNYISISAKHWKSDTNKIMVAKFEPLDIDELANKLENQKRHMNRYRQLCLEAGCFELAYEDMFGAQCTSEDKRRILDRIFAYLEIDGIDQLPPEASTQFGQLLNPHNRKLNSSSTYRMIPNIEEIEAHLGSAENGYLFKEPVGRANGKAAL